MPGREIFANANFIPQMLTTARTWPEPIMCDRTLMWLNCDLLSPIQGGLEAAGSAVEQPGLERFWMWTL